MNDNYVFYINNSSDYAFCNIGTELFKLAIGMTYSNNNKRTFAITDINYLKIIHSFINLKFELLDLSKIKNNYSCISLTINNYKEIDNSNNNCIINMDFSFKMIDDNIRELLSLAIIGNPKYTTIIYTKINDIMNHFKDYELNNYVFINHNKLTYNKNYYEKAYYNHFSHCKMIILTDDINITIKNLDFININKCYFILNDFNYRFINFVLFSYFNNVILDKDNYTGLWSAYIGNLNKKVIVPLDINNCFYLSNWLKQ